MAYWCCVAATRALKTLNGGSMDGCDVQVISVGRSLNKEGVSQLVCAAAWDFVDPIVVPCVVTNGVGCNVVRLLSCSNEFAGFLLSQKFIRRQCRCQPFNHPIAQSQAE